MADQRYQYWFDPYTGIARLPGQAGLSLDPGSRLIILKDKHWTSRLDLVQRAWIFTYYEPLELEPDVFPIPDGIWSVVYSKYMLNQL